MPFEPRPGPARELLPNSPGLLADQFSSHDLQGAALGDGMQKGPPNGRDWKERLSDPLPLEKANEGPK